MKARGISALVLVLVASVTSSFACVRVAEDRTERELSVGHAEASGLAVDIEDGLASVRRLDEGSVELWSQAPAFGGRIASLGEGAFGRSLFVLAHNCLPDARLEAAAADGRPLAVAPEETGDPRGVRKAWRIEASDASAVAFRIAPPDALDRTPFRFATLSDVQEALGSVEDIHRVLNRDESIRFVLGIGDLTRQGTDDELLEFQQRLEVLRVPYYATLGNHELGTNDGEPFHRLFGRGNFTFVYRGVRFTLIDSGSATLAPQAYERLERWLEEGRDAVHVVGMHIAPIDPVGVRNGSFASRNEAAKLLGRLAAGGVDLTLYAHIHSYYSFHNAGIPAFISGGGGAIPERFDGLGRHVMVFDIDATRGLLGNRVVRVD
jgi:hypothetical protein